MRAAHLAGATIDHQHMASAPGIAAHRGVSQKVQILSNEFNNQHPVAQFTLEFCEQRLCRGELRWIQGLLEFVPGQ